MADELYLDYNGSGTIYALLRRLSDGYVWNGSAFVVWADADVANYDIPLASRGGDLYTADFPAAITAAGFYRASYRLQAGAAPALADLPLGSPLLINWTGSSPTPGAGLGTMTLTTARTWVRNSVKDGGSDGEYSDTQIDQAILYVGQQFCRVTRCLKKVDSVALVASGNTFDLTTPIANGFRPERFIDCYLSGEYDAQLSAVDYHAYNDLLARNVSEARPRVLAFEDWTTARVWPTPDAAAYTARLRYWLPFVDFTPGTLSPGSVTLNLPNDYLPPILTDGAGSIVKFPSKERAFASEGWKRYLAYERGMRGAGSLGVRVVQREPLRNCEPSDYNRKYRTERF